MISRLKTKIGNAVQRGLEKIVDISKSPRTSFDFGEYSEKDLSFKQIIEYAAQQRKSDILYNVQAERLNKMIAEGQQRINAGVQKKITELTQYFARQMADTNVDKAMLASRMEQETKLALTSAVDKMRMQEIALLEKEFGSEKFEKEFSAFMGYEKADKKKFTVGGKLADLVEEFSPKFAGYARPALAFAEAALVLGTVAGLGGLAAKIVAPQKAVAADSHSPIPASLEAKKQYIVQTEGARFGGAADAEIENGQLVIYLRPPQGMGWAQNEAKWAKYQAADAERAMAFSSIDTDKLNPLMKQMWRQNVEQYHRAQLACYDGAKFEVTRTVSSNNKNDIADNKINPACGGISETRAKGTGTGYGHLLWHKGERLPIPDGALELVTMNDLELTANGVHPEGAAPPPQNPGANGQNPAGQNPAGQNPPLPVPPGQNPAGQLPAGQNPSGQAPTAASPNATGEQGIPRYNVLDNGINSKTKKESRLRFWTGAGYNSLTETVRSEVLDENGVPLADTRTSHMNYIDGHIGLGVKVTDWLEMVAWLQEMSGNGDQKSSSLRYLVGPSVRIGPNGGILRLNAMYAGNTGNLSLEDGDIAVDQNWDTSGADISLVTNDLLKDPKRAVWAYLGGQVINGKLKTDTKIHLAPLGIPDITESNTEDYGITTIYGGVEALVIPVGNGVLGGRLDARYSKVKQGPEQQGITVTTIEPGIELIQGLGKNGKGKNGKHAFKLVLGGGYSQVKAEDPSIKNDEQLYGFARIDYILGPVRPTPNGFGLMR